MKVSKSARKTLRTGIRWKKGQSSSSNPRCHRFRDAAAKKLSVQDVRNAELMSEVTTGSKLTPAALRSLPGPQLPSQDLDALSQATGDSALTWATNFTGCTNTAFDKLLNQWTSQQNGEARRQSLAVLAAVTQLIQSKGGSESDEEYFQALLTALVSVDDSIKPPCALLLSHIMRKLNANFLQKTFPIFCKSCLPILNQVAEDPGASTTLVKSLVQCLGIVLSSLDKLSWNLGQTKQVLQFLLNFCLSDKPRIRKSALAAVSELVASPTCPKSPMIEIVQFCTDRLNEGGHARIPALHLLRDTISKFSQKQIKTSVEAVLASIQLADAKVYGSGMEVLQRLFSSCPSIANLPVDMNGQMLTALHDLKPSAEDILSVTAWLRAARSGIKNLISIDVSKKVAEPHLTKLFHTCFNMLKVSHTAISKEAYSACYFLLTEELPLLDVGGLNFTKLIFAVVADGLSYQFHSAWVYVINLLNTFFRCYGNEGFAFYMTACVTQLAELRDTLQEQDLVLAIDKTFVTLLEVVGPRQLLAKVPLKLDPSCADFSFARSWLLPLLKKHVTHSELTFYTEYFLPLATQNHEKMETLKTENKLPDAKVLCTLEDQIWALLPSFCSDATDLVTAFPSVARSLATWLETRPEVRLHVLTALRRLLESAQSNDKFKTMMSNYSKNYLPRLFTIYTDNSVSLPTRLATLETVRAYMKCCQPALIETWIQNIHTKIVSNQHDARLLDLLIAMVPSMESAHIDLLCKLCDSFSLSENVSFQKKCFRMLQEILLVFKNGGVYTVEHLNTVAKILRSSQHKVFPSSRKPRLRCLALLVILLHPSKTTSQEFVEAVLPEAILGTQEQNSKAKESAERLLLEIYKFFVSADVSFTLDKFITALLSCSDKQEDLFVASLNAVSSILPSLKMDMTKDILESIIARLLTSISSDSRLTVKASLQCLLIVVQKFSNMVLLASVMQCLSSLSEKLRLPFRFTTRLILTKLYKVFPYSTLRSSTPLYYHKILNNIRKRTEHKKKGTSQRGDATEDGISMKTKKILSIDELLQDSDDDEDEPASVKTKESKKQAGKTKKRSETWLEEEGEDILDLADLSIATKLHRSEPAAKRSLKTKSSTSAFRLAPDGRMIIEEEEEVTGAADSDGSDLEAISEAGEDAEEKSAEKSQPRYKPGGRGIHRASALPGNKYASKKGTGDVKKKDALDPHSFVTLNRSLLNRRNKQSRGEQLKNFRSLVRRRTVKKRKK